MEEPCETCSYISVSKCLELVTQWVTEGIADNYSCEEQDTFCDIVHYIGESLIDYASLLRPCPPSILLSKKRLKNLLLHKWQLLVLIYTRKEKIKELNALQN